jgi:uncharacterized repeat protein (TIGR01451 family)
MNTLLRTFVLVWLFSLLGMAEVQAQGPKAYIPDSAFRVFLQINYPTCMVGDSLITNCQSVVLSTALFVQGQQIKNLDGIQYFTALSNLQCSFNQLMSLPTLPSSLQILFCSQNKLTSLPTLPSNLQELDCGGNQLTSLPTLPSSLQELQCSNNKLTSLLTLPSNLEYLDCAKNQLTSLPTLPSSLKFLSSDQNQFTSLPTLPSNLQTLTCNDNQLTSLPTLPSNLQTLACNDNNLTSLPTLPSSLMKLFCSINQLISLPTLPNSLKDLNCSNNQLTSLPTLLSNLEYLDCSNNQLTSLPPLPSTLQYLHCIYNQLTSLPTLPSTLTDLECFNNQLISLPNLPDSLIYLGCHSNQITCLPILPATINILTFSSNPINCLPNKPNAMIQSNFSTYPFCQVGNLYNCIVFPKSRGKVFLDLNSDGVQNANEKGVWNQAVKIQQNGYLFFTDSLGRYEAATDTGQYSLFANFDLNLTYWNAVPDSHTVWFSANNQVDSLNDFALQPKALVKDLQITVGADRPFARPAFPITYHLTHESIGTLDAGDSIVFYYDAQQTFTGSSVPPTSHVGNKLTWNIAQLAPFERRGISASFVVDTFVPLFSTLYNQATIYPVVGDTTPADNQYNHQIGVVNSYDPNAKVSNPPSLTPAQVAANQPLTYTIHFQNLGTASAIDVRIADTLSPRLNLATFEMIAASHPNYSLSIINRVAKWEFLGINLADSASNEPASHGWVTFKITPQPGLLLGDSLVNRAGIYFDYNKVVLTNNSVCKVVQPTATDLPTENLDLSVYPNPSNGSVTVSATLAHTGLVTFEVLSLTGQQVYRSSYNIAAGAFQLPLAMPDVAAGVYTLVVSTTQGRAHHKLVVAR